jgi:hypothetical protein
VWGVECGVWVWVWSVGVGVGVEWSAGV